MHLGIDTVNLHGAPFTVAVKAGQHVNKGDLLGTMDRAAIEKAGLDPTTMVLITNSKAYARSNRLPILRLKPAPICWQCSVKMSKSNRFHRRPCKATEISLNPIALVIVTGDGIKAFLIPLV